MNYPGQAEGNWRWRFSQDALTEALLDKLTAWTEVYRRAPMSPGSPSSESVLEAAAGREGVRA
jgi:hypothetical protein